MKITIRTWLLLVAAISIPFAAYVHRYQTREQIARMAISSGGQVLWYSGDQNFSTWYSSPTKQTQLSLVRRCFGAHVGIHLQAVQAKVTDENLEAWNQLLSRHHALRGLSVLDLSIKTTHEPFCHSNLAKLDDVRLLEISGAELDEAWIKSLSDMQDLELLWLQRSKLVSSIQSLAALRNLKHLAWLEISGEGLSNEQIKTLREFLPETYISVY